MTDSHSDDTLAELGISEEAYNKLLENVSGLANQIIQSNWEMAKHYQPIVQNIFDTGCTDSKIICRILDHLSDPMGCEPAFKMFIKLLAWLEPHDPEAVQYYREDYYLFHIREDIADLEGEGWDW